MKTFFKVLVLGRSCSIDDRDFETTYQVGKWVKSPKKNTPLFVFDSLENANNFVNGTNSQAVSPAKWGLTTIFSCHVKNPRKAPKTICSNLGFGLGFYWESKQKKKKLSSNVLVSTPVKGSFVADSVKILEKVA